MDVDENKPVVEESDKMDVVGKESEERAGSKKEKDDASFNQNETGKDGLINGNEDKSLQDKIIRGVEVGGPSCSRGTVLKLYGVPTIYDIIEEAVMVTSSEVDVGSMDFLPGHVVHVRLLNEGDAYLVMKNLTDGEMEIGDRVLQATVLEGEEEEAALKKAKKVGGPSTPAGAMLKLSGVPTMYDLIKEAVMLSTTEVDVMSMEFFPGHIVHVKFYNEGDPDLVVDVNNGELMIADRILEASVVEEALL